MADNNNPPPPEENQIAESSTTPPKDDTSLETIVRRFQESMSDSKTHKFWETQPVGQFKDIGDTSLPEGPIEPATPLSEVKQEPYNLPSVYEWTTCDMTSDDICSEVYNLLKNNYVEDDENMFRFNYSKEFLRWALRPPGYYQSWHIGVRAKTNKKLVAFISGVPARIRVRGEVVKMAEINFLCVHKKLRSKRLAPVMIKEVREGFTWRISGKRLTRRVKMELLDVPAVTRFRRSHLGRFGVATDFDENDVEHWLLPREDVVDSYLLYTLPSSILGNQNYTTLKAAYSYYNVATRTPLVQLMNDALIVCKQKGFDVVNPLDVMHNDSFLKQLKFGPGDGQLHYYLYNYRLRSALKPSELGLLLSDSQFSNFALM
ncbi:hypothetical protein Bca52824_036021 [Brassica carinata]|uniref:Glycylpeptide N-tetradecanoyltransferase n=1 Tax=Brassica carinata TaxID=52824 RepID=A0A8X7V298_BRACI|nr:hypothetical protein Bca52824_036021 [Brassica carinata]